MFNNPLNRPNNKAIFQWKNGYKNDWREQWKQLMRHSMETYNGTSGIMLSWNLQVPLIAEGEVTFAAI